MTDNIAPNSVPDPIDEVATSGPPEPGVEKPGQDQSDTDSGWETVSFPGQISPVGATSSNASTVPEQPQVESTVLPPSNSQESPTNTDELIQLIQDLNHCNDALLNRVSHLEDSLEQAQSALQTEIDRSQAHGGHSSGPVPQQVAQLLGELDVANDGLRRTTMHNEALQAELDISQQRVAQLERECTLLQQRFSEKSAALQQADNTCRDLKARLHRQQRYTLQFKAALEKCLNMTAQNPSGSAQNDFAPGEEGGGSQPVSMPKTQQIQPWTSQDSTQPRDLNLNDLLRGLKTTDQVSAPPAANYGSTPAPPPPLEKAADPEAEALLWKDLARVTDSQPAPPPPAATAPEADPWQPSEPSGGAPPASPVPTVPPSDGAEELTFTEPSPWGMPLPDPTPPATADELPSSSPESAALMPQSPAQPDPGAAYPPEADNPEVPNRDGATHPPAAAAPDVALPGYLRGLPQSNGASPAPLVYPLRSQKKRKSLSAVELPSFGRPTRRR